MTRVLAGPVFALAILVGACVGSDPSPDPAAPSGGGDGGGAPVDSGLAPDAAPPAGCPLGCLPPPPAGWTGPSATYDGTAENPPNACPPPYVQPEIDAHQEMTAGPAVCGCGTPSFSGAKCTATVEAHGTTACSSTAQATLEGAVTIPGSPCVVISNDTAPRIKVGTPVLDRGACSFPAPTETVPSPTFGKIDRACGLPQLAECPGRSDCTAAPVPGAPFTRLCIHKAGDVACPSADYAQRFVAFKKVDDTRGCSACSGGPTGGACTDKWGTSATCTGTPVAYTSSSCVTNPGFGTVVNAAAMVPSGITCSPTAASGLPTGTAVSTEPVTFCCNK